MWYPTPFRFVVAGEMWKRSFGLFNNALSTTFSVEWKDGCEWQTGRDV